jgi:hypothetical protein
MAVIPYNKNLHLTAKDIAVGLRLRTLWATPDAACRHCAQSNSLGHDEVCQQRPNWRLARHEHAKRVLAYHLRKEPNTEIVVEPHVPDGRARTDLRITGPVAYRSTSCELDLTIVSPFRVQARHFARAGDPASSDAFRSATRGLERFLVSKETEKNARYQGQTASHFYPLVMSLGGTLSPMSRMLFEHWRACLGSYSYTQMMYELSVSLLRARARFFDVAVAH